MQPVTAEEYAQALAAGDLYLCPLYTNGQRANVSARCTCGEQGCRNGRWGGECRGSECLLVYPPQSLNGRMRQTPSVLTAPTRLPPAQVYSPLVGTFTLKTQEPASKWVLASTALLLQDETA